MGVPAARVEKPEEIGPAIKQMLASPGPFLIDLVLEGTPIPNASATPAASNHRPRRLRSVDGAGD